MHQQLLVDLKASEATNVASLALAPNILRVGILGAFFLASCAHTPTPNGPAKISARIEASAPKNRKQLAESLYRKLYAPYCSAESKPPEHRLDEIFRAVNILHFYSYDEKPLACLIYIFNQLHRKRQASAYHNATLVGAFIQSRRFDLAEEYSTRLFVEIDLPQNVIDSREYGSSVWELSSDGAVLSKKAFIAPPLHIIAVVHPNCKFSQQAMSFISRDKRLSSLFRDHATLLLPADRRLNTSSVLEWNKANLALPMVYVDQPNDWAFIEDWSTPQFLLVSHGKVLGAVSGWVPDESPSRLESLVRVFE